MSFFEETNAIKENMAFLSAMRAGAAKVTTSDQMGRELLAACKRRGDLPMELAGLQLDYDQARLADTDSEDLKLKVGAKMFSLNEELTRIEWFLEDMSSVYASLLQKEAVELERLTKEINAMAAEFASKSFTPQPLADTSTP